MESIRQRYHQPPSLERMSTSIGTSHPSTPGTPSDTNRRPWHTFHKIVINIGNQPYMKPLLLMVPIGVLAGLLHLPAQIVFYVNLTALIPLIALVTICIADLSVVIGRVWDEFLRATVGNAIELILGVIAMTKGYIRMAQSTLIGSILCYTLLVLGSCFCVAGYNKEHLHFDRTLINIMSSLMVVVCTSLLVPTIMITFPSFDTVSPQASVTRQEVVLASRVTAVTLLILLGVFLLFQLKTHASIFHLAEISSDYPLDDQDNADRDSAQDQPARFFTPRAAVVTLLSALFGLTLCAYFLVDNVNRVADELNIDAAFLMLVVVPLIGNSTRYLTIVTVARKGYVESAVRAIINSVLRLTLLIIPALVILGWAFGSPMTLQLDTFEATMLFLATVVMNHVIQDGRSNYFDGLMLVGTYIISAASFYMRPNK